MSNNSVTLKANCDYNDFTHIPEMAARIRDNGEPGMINLYNIQKFGRYGKEMPDKANLVNPCVTDDMWIQTSNGSCKVKDLIGKSFTSMVDGKLYECKTGFFLTGKKYVYKLVTKEGFELRATGNHKIMTSNNEWVELQNLIYGDKIKIHDHSKFEIKINETSDDFAKGWLLGSLYGNGTFDYNQKRAYLVYWEDTKYEMSKQAINYLLQLKYRSENLNSNGYDCIEYDKIVISNNELFRIAENYIEKGKYIKEQIEKESVNFRSGFLRGWFDSDGSVQGNKIKGVSVRLTCSTLSSLIRAQRMCLSLGIYGRIYKNRHPEMDKLMPDGHGGQKLYHCKAVHELVISRAGIKLYNDRIGFFHNHKSNKLQDIINSYKRPLYGVRYEAEIESIELDEECNVYDATIEDIHAFDANGIYVHNCGEISLNF
jgi:ribonucleotide reductase class II